MLPLREKAQTSSEAPLSGTAMLFNCTIGASSDLY